MQIGRSCFFLACLLFVEAFVGTMSATSDAQRKTAEAQHNAAEIERREIKRFMRQMGFVVGAAAFAMAGVGLWTHPGNYDPSRLSTAADRNRYLPDKVKKTVQAFDQYVLGRPKTVARR